LVDNPHDWLNHDVLELAGPALIERQELYDFVVTELKLREGIGRKKVSTLRKALQNQRDDILGFAQVLDDKLVAIAQKLDTPLLGAADVSVFPETADLSSLLASLGFSAPEAVVEVPSPL
jgi:hypothetical protein